MHRHIESDDVVAYSSEANKKKVQLLKDEDIEYRDGLLFHSSGKTDVKIKGKSHNNTEHSISEAFEAEGSYTLDLQQCLVPAKHVLSRKRRSLSEKMDQDLSEEYLKVHYDKCKNDVSYAYYSNLITLLSL